MRFQNSEAVSQIIDTVKRGHTPRVTLKREENSAGVDGYAVAVCVLGEKVGYVRNSDLPGLFKAVESGERLSDVYKVITVRTNYWVLQKGELEVASNRTTIPTVDLPHYSTITETSSNTKGNKMNINTNSMRDSFFREVKNVAIDIQSGKFGVVSADGISVYVNGGVSVNPIADMGVKIPAYAMRISIDSLTEGDIILNGNDASFFRAKTENGYEVVTLAGEVKQVGQVSNMFFGKNTVLAVKNMFGEGAGMNPLMLAMLMGEDKSDNKNLMLAMAMSGGMGNLEGMSGMNPLMLMMLMK